MSPLIVTEKWQEPDPPDDEQHRAMRALDLTVAGCPCRRCASLRDHARISRDKFGQEGPEALAAITRTCERPGPVTVSKRAAASIEGAAQIAFEIAEDRLGRGTTLAAVEEEVNAARAVREGETTVTLSDGGVIKVKTVSWRELARAAGVPDLARHVEGNWPRSYLQSRRREVLIAFNSEERVPA
jgi:hypothetical protein